MKPVQLIWAPADDGGAWRVQTLQTLATRGPARLLVVPGALVLARTVDAVGRTEAQARAAALASLASDLATSPEASICALAPVSNNRRLAFVISRTSLERLLADARALGHTPDAVVPDYALLPAPAPGHAAIAQHGDALVRTHDGGFACQPDLASTLLAQLQQQEIDLDAAVSEVVRAGHHAALPNLALKAKPTAAPAARLPIAGAIAAATALTIFAALPWIDVWRLNAATADIRQEAEETARAALPEGARIVNPLAQLREAGLPRTQAAESLDRAITMMEGLARSPGVAVTRLEVDQAAVRASVGVSSTSLLQPLRDHIAASGMQLVETPGLSQPNNIPVQLEIARP